METENQIALIDEIRQKLRLLTEQTEAHALYECYKTADMNLRWAEWLQGEVEEIMPELEQESRPLDDGRSERCWTVRRMPEKLAVVEGEKRLTHRSW